jgi:gluconokinase
MPKAKSGVLALDLGTSSVRAVVYDARGAMLDPTLTDLPYKVRTTDAGEVSSDPDALVKLITKSIDGALKAARKQNVNILGVGVSCYWHSLMGVDRAGRPTTELLTWADTRSTAETRGMRAHFDERAYHARTGCFFHASYWPAKLRWLRTTRRNAVRRTAHWISLGEYLYQELHGDLRVSHSIASGTGLLDVNRCRWDDGALRLAGITAEQLSPLADWDQPARSLRSSFAGRWPELRDVPWYLPLGDGGLANIGAGCVGPRWACATIGTSSALRVLLDRPRLTVPWGTFVYRVDRRRYVVGGALSEGGNVVRWFTDTLGLKPKKQFERAAGGLQPDSHGLTVLPFWAGERSPNWRGDARAVIAGLSLGTQPAQLLRAPTGIGDCHRRAAHPLAGVEPDAGRRARSPGDDFAGTGSVEPRGRAARAPRAAQAPETLVVESGTRSQLPAARQRACSLRARATPAAAALCAVVSAARTDPHPALPQKGREIRRAYRRGGIRFQNEGSSKPSRQTLIPFKPYSYISGSLRRSVSGLWIHSSCWIP